MLMCVRVCVCVCVCIQVCVCFVRVCVCTCARTCAEPLSHLQSQQREQEGRERRALEVGQRRREGRERRETAQRANMPMCMCYGSSVRVHRMWTQSVKYSNTYTCRVYAYVCLA